jgi:hypothetical protein
MSLEDLVAYTTSKPQEHEKIATAPKKRKADPVAHDAGTSEADDARQKKLLAIIAKLRAEDAEDESEVPFRPSEQYKPKSAKKGKAKAVEQPDKKKKSKPVVKEDENHLKFTPLKKYKPGIFQKARVEYMNKKKHLGFTHREASLKWMSSKSQRRVLATLGEAELRRRRFI